MVARKKRPSPLRTRKAPSKPPKPRKAPKPSQATRKAPKPSPKPRKAPKPSPKPRKAPKPSPKPRKARPVPMRRRIPRGSTDANKFPITPVYEGDTLVLLQDVSNGEKDLLQRVSDALNEIGTFQRVTATVWFTTEADPDNDSPRGTIMTYKGERAIGYDVSPRTPSDKGALAAAVASLTNNVGKKPLAIELRYEI